MGKVVALAAVAYFVAGLVVGLIADAIGWDQSALEFALVMGLFGAVFTAVQERRERRR